MKKISIVLWVLAIIVSSCKKEDGVSQVVNTSYPTITFNGPKYFSIPVGGNLPVITASAYDSLLNEICPVMYDASGINNNEPGLYTIPVEAKNKYGYIGNDIAYVAVTDVPATADLSGEYKRMENNAPVVITKLGNGLYRTNDVGGVPSLQVAAVFVQLNDSVLSLPPQFTTVGELSCIDAKVSFGGTDTVIISWSVKNTKFGAAKRNFIRQ